MKLFVVATPIGNLKDFSERAIATLKQVDLILAEDTRHTKKLLNHFNIKNTLLSYHQHSKLKKTEYIINLLKQGKTLALVSDAGVPGISDPGNKLVKELVEHGVEIIPIPGPSALTAAASISGFPMDKFLFSGFPPQKRKRTSFFKQVLSSKYPVILYESPHRILKTLEELKDLNSGLEVCLCRELTKKFETVYRGKISEVLEKLKKDVIKGEFVLIVKS